MRTLLPEVKDVFTENGHKMHGSSSHNVETLLPRRYSYTLQILTDGRFC